jgi:hypothetical protein
MQTGAGAYGEAPVSIITSSASKNMAARTTIPIATQRLVLHEAGYKCANPVCRVILTLEIHHMDYVSEDGSNEPENLLPLCPNCHSLHHQGNIPKESLRSWKMLLLSLNEAFDHKAVDLLLALDKLKDGLFLSGDGFLACAALVTSGMVKVEVQHYGVENQAINAIYYVSLSSKGRSFVDAWKRGDQRAAVRNDAEPGAAADRGGTS